MASNDDTRCVTPVCILSYPHLAEPVDPPNAKPGSKKRYQAELVFKDPSQIQDLKNAANAAVRARWGTKPPRGVKTPFDTRGEEFGYGEGSIFVRANSPKPPGLIRGPRKTPVTDKEAIEEQFYPGCKVICELNASAYELESGQSRGVKFWLNAVWKVGDGERLAPERNAEDAFNDMDVDPEVFGSLEDEDLEETTESLL